MYTKFAMKTLMQKQGIVFWKRWNAQFGKDKSGITIADGVSDTKTIISHFAEYFSNICANSTIAGSKRLRSAYRLVMLDIAIVVT